MTPDVETACIRLADAQSVETVIAELLQQGARFRVEPNETGWSVYVPVEFESLIRDTLTSALMDAEPATDAPVPTAEDYLLEVHEPNITLVEEAEELVHEAVNGGAESDDLEESLTSDSSDDSQRPADSDALSRDDLEASPLELSDELPQAGGTPMADGRQDLSLATSDGSRVDSSDGVAVDGKKPPVPDGNGDGDAAGYDFDGENPVLAARLPGPRPNPTRVWVAVGVSGVLGALVGCYTLLWLGHDPFGASAIVPTPLLPPEMRNPEPDPTTAPVVAEPLVDDTSEVTVNVLTVAPAEPDEPDSTEESGLAAEEADAEVRARLLPLFRMNREELLQAQAAAAAAQPQLTQGTLQDGKQVRLAKRDAYLTFCRLAESVALAPVDIEFTSLEPWTREAHKLAAAVLSESHMWTEVAAFGSHWFAREQRDTDGIFVTGTVRSVQQHEHLHEFRLDVESSKPVTIDVFSADAPSFQAGQRVMVLGVIVEEPSLMISFYTGEDRRVLWSVVAESESSGTDSGSSSGP